MNKGTIKENAGWWLPKLITGLVICLGVKEEAK